MLNFRGLGQTVKITGSDPIKPGFMVYCYRLMSIVGRQQSALNDISYTSVQIYLKLHSEIGATCKPKIGHQRWPPSNLKIYFELLRLNQKAIGSKHGRKFCDDLQIKHSQNHFDRKFKMAATAAF